MGHFILNNSYLAVMKIGFDAKRLFLNNTGLGNYSRTLVSNLKRYYPELDLYLFTPSAPQTESNLEFHNQDLYTIVSPPSTLFNAQWRSKGLVKQIDQLGLDIYHGLSNELPIAKTANTKYVVTIHDVIFMAFPKQYKVIDRKIYSAKTKHALSQADLVLSISDATTKDLQLYFPQQQPRIKKLYQTCGWEYEGRAESNKTYFLYVSSVTERKNLLTILKAIYLLGDKTLTLIVIGSGGKYEQACKAYIKEHNLQEQVLFIGNVSNAQLKQYYIDAIALVYPSLKEGFGIPVIEAIASGTHVVTSKLSSMLEAGGSLARFVNNPMDEVELATALNSVQLSTDLEPEAIKQHLAQFHPEKLTDQLVQYYTELM